MCAAFDGVHGTPGGILGALRMDEHCRKHRSENHKGGVYSECAVLDRQDSMCYIERWVERPKAVTVYANILKCIKVYLELEWKVD